jgi:4-hydroxy 2-oxovalerate aldolase
MKIKILDCTLRDGGYYTNWDFDDQIVESYCKAIAKLPVEYIEIGYRNGSKSGYFGQYYFLPISTVKRIRKLLSPQQKISVMLNCKDIKSIDDLTALISDLKGLVDLVRLTSPIDKVSDVMPFVKAIRDMGFETAINLMYLSKWTEKDVQKMVEQVKNHQNQISYLYLVDSYGGVTPNQISGLLKEIKNNKINIPLGFHGHNNMELALANSIICLEENVQIIDATILGMGRGAGNLKTELFLIYLKENNLCSFEYSDLSAIVSSFYELLEEYKWGTNFPYMISGSKSLPQQDIMDLLSTNRYSVDDIVGKMGLHSIANSEDYLSLSNCDEELSQKRVLIIGGGESVVKHKIAITEFLEKNSDIILIYSTTHHANLFNHVNNKKVLCLLESKNTKISELETNFLDKVSSFVMVIGARDSIKNNKNYDIIKDRIFTNDTFVFKGLSNFIESPMLLSLQVALGLKAPQILIAGFDGYNNRSSVYQEFLLHKETQEAIDVFNKVSSCKIESITPSSYDLIEKSSIYLKIS